MRLSIPEAHAHCDIPCGIYETDTLRHSANTVRRMIEKMIDLGEIDTPEKLNTFTRAVVAKEDHAERIKHELSVLWGDYFKPEHLEKLPDLHTTIWMAMKQASIAKQTMSLEAADTLIEHIGKVSDLFAASKA